MKTVYLFLFVLLLGGLNTKAQQNINDVQGLNYYGIDFSKVKVYQAKETPEQFRVTFKAINALTQKEDKKYNFGKFFNKPMEWKSFDVADQRNEENTTPVMLSGRMSSKELSAAAFMSQEEVKDVIGNYGNGDNGVGVVIIATLLNKHTSEGEYNVVFFDVKTKEIIFQKQVVGKAGGAGLRNFWANSVYDAAKGWKYKLK